MLAAPRCTPAVVRSRYQHLSSLTIRSPATVVVKSRRTPASRDQGRSWPLQATTERVSHPQRQQQEQQQGKAGVESFTDLGISPGLQAAMAQHGLLHPTEIQVLSATAQPQAPTVHVPCAYQGYPARVRAGKLTRADFSLPGGPEGGRRAAGLPHRLRQDAGVPASRGELASMPSWHARMQALRACALTQQCAVPSCQPRAAVRSTTARCGRTNNTHMPRVQWPILGGAAAWSPRGCCCIANASCRTPEPLEALHMHPRARRW